uniref:Uncharacterized protein n=1 Tax=Ciona intestinalis TaxID=7719 RepID=H2Y0X2_CIOIN
MLHKKFNTKLKVQYFVRLTSFILYSTQFCTFLLHNLEKKHFFGMCVK